MHRRKLRGAVGSICLLAGLAVGAVLVTPQAAYAARPSFDCGKARTASEKALCADADLARSDREMADLYTQARRKAQLQGGGLSSKLRTAQRGFLSDREACMGQSDSRACLTDLYETRIFELQVFYGLQDGGQSMSVQEYRSLDPVPEEVLRAARRECDGESVMDNAARYQKGFSFELWEVPCWSAAYNFGSAFVLVPTGRLDAAEVVRFPNIKGEPALTSLTSPTLDPKTGRIEAFHKGRGVGDCGTYHHYAWDGGTRFALVEYREKADCDERYVEPDKYPLVYRGY